MISNFLIKLLIFIKVYGLILYTKSVEIVIDDITYTEQTDRLAKIGAFPGTTNYLKAYYALISQNNKFALVVHPSGNAILYLIEPNHWAYGMILWQTNLDNQGFYANEPDDLWLYLWQWNVLALYRMDIVHDPAHDWEDGELWRSNGIRCEWGQYCWGHVAMQDDGNFVMYDNVGNFVWGTMNNYAPGYLIPVDSYTSLSGDGAYRYLIAYIPNDGQSYEDAKNNNQEWCLSAGFYYTPDAHELNDQYNLYWCDNHPDANQKCKCLGIHGDGWWTFYVNGERYELAFHKDTRGEGNEIQDDEYNLKGINADIEDYFGHDKIWNWVNDQFVCRKLSVFKLGIGYEHEYWCMEWDAEVQGFRDSIDGTLKNGREAKLQYSERKGFENPEGDIVEWRDEPLQDEDERDDDNNPWNDKQPEEVPDQGLIF